MFIESIITAEFTNDCRELYCLAWIATIAKLVAIGSSHSTAIATDVVVAAAIIEPAETASSIATIHRVIIIATLIIRLKVIIQDKG